MAATRPVPPTRRDAGARRHVKRRGRSVTRGRTAASRPRVLLSLLALALVVSGGLVAATVAYHEHRPAKIGAPATTAGEQGSPTPTPAPSDTTSGSASAGLWAVAPSPVAAVLTPLRKLPSAAPLPKPAGLTKMLAPLLADPAFAGDTISLVVADPLSGAVLLNTRGADAVLPASTAKLAVAVAALEVLGPDRRFATSAALAHDGRVLLVGGGDPTLAGPKAVGLADPGFPAPARLSDLAKQAASALKARGITAVTVGYDESLFDGPRTAPGWKPLYITEGDVAPVSALEVDEGRPDLTKPSRAPDPAAVAAAQFVALLSANGVRVTGTPSPATAGAGFATLASVQSPRLSALVQRMLGRSDNDLAEALARQVAIATGKPATFTGGADAVRAVVAKLGVAPAGLAMVDGSGLSRSDRVRPQALVQLVDVVLSSGNPRLAPVLQALPVGGFSGTLAARYTAPPAAGAAGLVRAKSGTLDGVVALAGYLDDASGRVLSFAVVVNGVAHNATVRTEAALDRLMAGLTRCGCT